MNADLLIKRLAPLFSVHIISSLVFYFLKHPSVGESRTPFPGLLHFTLDTYLIVLCVKQGGIKYPFLSFWYYSTCD